MAGADSARHEGGAVDAVRFGREEIIVEKMIDDLATATDPVERMAGAYRVALPRLVARYQAHRELTSPAADGPSIRTLDLLEIDESNACVNDTSADCVRDIHPNAHGLETVGVNPSVPGQVFDHEFSEFSDIAHALTDDVFEGPDAAGFEGYEPRRRFVK